MQRVLGIRLSGLPGCHRPGTTTGNTTDDHRNPHPPLPRTVRGTRRARQDELLTTLADGVQALTTSDGWRRYLRAMASLRTYSTGQQPYVPKP